MGAIAGSFDGKDEAIRNLRRPLAKGRRCLRAIESAVDLDRSEVARGVAEFLRMRQAIGIEHAPPRREGPTADADVDMCGRLGLSQLGFWRCKLRRGILGHDARPWRSLMAAATIGAARRAESRICLYLAFGFGTG